jgi:allantoicase
MNDKKKKENFQSLAKSEATVTILPLEKLSLPQQHKYTINVLQTTYPNIEHVINIPQQLLIRLRKIEIRPP